MLAIIENGGKHYTISENTILDIDIVEGEKGQVVTFDKILLLQNEKGIQIGTPYVAGATVKGKILEHYKDKKEIVFKFKRKTGYKKKQGHRQNHTTIKFEETKLG